jgi:hypothetical protein
MVRSRVLIGAGAWLLGAVAATAGSLYAVDQLGEGLFAQHSKQVSVAMVNVELAQAVASRPAQIPTPSPSPSPTPKVSPSAHKVRPVLTHRAANPVTKDSSKLLTSSGGTAVASCGPGGAYLHYWSPNQGFETHKVVRGPSSAASVTFASNSSDVVLRVTCSSAGVPTPHVSTNNWGHHDE